MSLSCNITIDGGRGSKLKINFNEFYSINFDFKLQRRKYNHCTFVECFHGSPLLGKQIQL